MYFSKDADSVPTFESPWIYRGWTPAIRLIRTYSNEFLFMANIVYMYHNCFIHLSVNGHLDCFHVLAIVNIAAVNNGIHVSFSILVSSGYMPRSGLAESYRGSIPNFLRNLHTTFHRFYLYIHFMET